MAFIYDIADTWAEAGTTFTGIKMNVTDTASATGSLLMDLQVGGSSYFTLRKDGRLEAGIAANRMIFNPATRSLILQNNAGETNGGIRYFGNSSISMIAGSQYSSTFVGNGMLNAATGFVGWHSSNYSWEAFTADLRLHRDAANTLAQRNGANNPQAFNLYNTYTDANNFERLAIKWVSNVLLIDAEKGTTGTQRHIKIGLANTGVGLSNGTATGVYSVACGNSGASGNYTFAAGESSASGGGSVAIGRNASAEGSNSIALGSLTRAYQANQFTYSNRWHTGYGDCQMSTFILGASTVDTTATEMSTQVASMARIVVRANTTWAFEITIVARSTGGVDNAMYMYRGMIKRDGANNTVLVGAVDNIYTNETNAAWDVAVTADDTTESLKVMVTGAAATNINWTGKVILTEVGII